MAPSVLAAGPVFCGLCNAEFASTKDRAEPHADRSPVDRNVPASAPSTAGIEAPARPVSGNDQRDRIEAALHRLLANDQRVDEPLPLDLPANRPAGPLAKVAELAPTADELAALAHWYQRFGRENESPMPTTDVDQAARLDRLARAVLEADGTLRGPTLQHPSTGRTFQAGDRVITNATGDDIPAGTLGTVEHINTGDRSMRIDFATLARIDSRIDDALTRALSYDYTEPAADHDADVDGIDVDIPM